MKKLAVISCWVFLAMSVPFCPAQEALGNNLVPLAEAVADAKPREVLGVDQLIRDVDRHKGLVRVQGVVTAVAPDKKMVALVDLEQFKKCGVLTCPTYLVLPVLWSGVMPSLKDAVIVEGQVKDSGGKLVFEAKNIEKLDTQSGGAK